jgi:hypothetical protein
VSRFVSKRRGVEPLAVTVGESPACRVRDTMARCGSRALEAEASAVALAVGFVVALVTSLGVSIACVAYLR